MKYVRYIGISLIGAFYLSFLALISLPLAIAIFLIQPFAGIVVGYFAVLFIGLGFLQLQELYRCWLTPHSSAVVPRIEPWWWESLELTEWTRL